MSDRAERIDKGSRRIGRGLFYKTSVHPVLPGQWLTIFYQRVKGGRAMLPHRHHERALIPEVIEEFREWGKSIA